MQQSGIIQEPMCKPRGVGKEALLQFCVDYRALNEVTKPDVFPLPRIDDLLDILGHLKYFNTLDLKCGYILTHQSGTSSRQKTAFMNHCRLYELPFGVNSAPAVFQRLMQSLLRGIMTDEREEFVDAFYCFLPNLLCLLAAGV